MIVGMNRLGISVGVDRHSCYLRAAVGDHLVGVHVGRGSGSCLVDINWELVIKLALVDLPGGLLNERSFIGGDMAQFSINTSSSPLNQAKSV